jgi:hypothetical protein
MDLHGESAAVVIVGGGPHALAALEALEGSVKNDSLHRVGTGSFHCRHHAALYVT